MSKIVIITDSSSGIPPEWQEQYPIHVIPLRVNWEGESIRDGVDITPEAFYARLEGAKELPTTSQASPKEFIEAFDKLADKYEGILVAPISSGISGTITAAQMAKSEYTRLPVEVVDTRATTTGLAMIVLAGARASQAGGDLAAVKKAVEDAAAGMKFYFVLDTLQYLYMGGRIGGAAKVFGSLMDIKPVLTLDTAGKIDMLEKVRTKKKALKRIIEILIEQAKGKTVHLGLYHSNAPEEAAEFLAGLKKEVEEHVAICEVTELELSPVVGSHTGPRTIGIAFYAEE